jgi:uncharacterized membrane protein required for colicin V production
MIVDLVATFLLLFFVVTGWRSGFISSLLGLVGYFGGGVVGLLLAKRFLSDPGSLFTTVALYLMFIFVSAELFQFLFKKIGGAIRKVILPIRLLDSFAGALLGALKTLTLIYFASSLLILLPNERVSVALKNSRVVQEVQDLAPEVIDSIFTQIAKK